MPTGEDLGTQRLPGEVAAPTRPCPYCGAPALRTVEETQGTGVLDVTLSVCFACGQSISSRCWTAVSTRRGLLLVLSTLGPFLLFAVAAWLLKPLLPQFPTGSSGAT